MLDFIIFIGRINYKYYMEDLFMSKYYSINKFSKILGVSAQTLRNWDKKGKPFEIISDIGSGIKRVNFIHITLPVMDIDIIRMSN